MEVKTVELSTSEGPKTISYTDWGEDTLAPPVLCVHGLTRNARDFDDLAAALSKNRRVICIDMIGRGNSDWFENKDLYSHIEYCAICISFLNALEIDVVEWVGTSMGGLIGLFLASETPSSGRIEKLIMNDVGSFVPKAPLERIGDYVGADPEFDSLQDATFYLRGIAQSFGPLTDEQWSHLAAFSFSERENGKFGFTYDPGIGKVFEAGLEDTDLSEFWNLVEQSTLLIRGKESDLLLEDTAKKMAARDNCTLVEFADVGHAPALMAEDQIAAIESFLN